METHTDPSEYETHDIYLAAYFKVAGCVLVRRYQEGRRWYFVFSNIASDVRELREDYFSGRAQVVAKDFAKEVQDMKQLCFN